jgi:hypothetical protein
MQLEAENDFRGRTMMDKAAERKRLSETQNEGVPWKKWGPYLSERQWGTVREDYSENGDAWGYFTHDQARSRAYKWGRTNHPESFMVPHGQR